ncbi:MAG: Kdo hydroxylase family protein [Thermoanaerobaculia bacterium]
MAIVRVEDPPRGGQNGERESCRTLEQGHVLLFRDTPFELSEEDRAFLLERRQAEAGYQRTSLIDRRANVSPVWRAGAGRTR